jgi:hypothetical protein
MLQVCFGGVFFDLDSPNCLHKLLLVILCLESHALFNLHKFFLFELQFVINALQVVFKLLIFGLQHCELFLTNIGLWFIAHVFVEVIDLGLKCAFNNCKV